jgi:DnaJ-domain-containing protein 1
MFRKFTQWFDNPPPKSAPENYPCDHQGCIEAGVYRAPKSRHQLNKGANDWYWLCLIHIRDYNNAWNYYSNMSESEVWEERHSDVTWDRPTWSVENNQKNQSFQYKFNDPFGFFGDTHTAAPTPSKNPDQEALDTLQLSIPFTRQELRVNYRKLVKQYHPDTNKDNPAAEEMIRKLNQAYSHLQKMIS